LHTHLTHELTENHGEIHILPWRIMECGMRKSPVEIQEKFIKNKKMVQKKQDAATGAAKNGRQRHSAKEKQYFHAY
jgi:hypothetical protein